MKKVLKHWRIYEETGLKNLKQLMLSENELVPIDIDTHLIEFNKRLNLPSHYHFDFRYLFTVDLAFHKGVKQEKIQTAKNMLALGFITVEQIAEVTGLTVEEINGLK